MRKPLAAITATGFVLALGASTLAQVAPAKAQYVPNSWYTEERKNADGSVSRIINQKWSNYYENGEWKRIDLRPQKTANGFLVSKAPFTLALPDYADWEVEFSATNRYDIAQKRERNDPVVTKYKQFTGASHVKGVQTSLGIEYIGALPVGDIVYKTETDEFSALVRLNSVPETCQSNPNAEILIPFTETYSGGLRPKNKGANIGATRKDVGDGYSVALNEFRGMSTKQAQVWDSALTEKRQNIAVRGRFSSGVFDAQKVLPCSFLLSATYPVFTDTTTTVRPNPNPETENFDGFIGNGIGATYAAVHDAATGNLSDDSGTTIEVENSDEWTNNYYVKRGIIQFNTTISGTVTACALTLTVNTVNANEQNESISIVSSTTASNTGVSAGDYNDFGTTKYATDILISDMTTSSVETWTCNASGIAAINTSGITSWGIRTARDVSATSPGTGGENMVIFRSADYSGTSSDPVLEITYTPAASGGGQVIFFL